jgi:hypothetical protein
VGPGDSLAPTDPVGMVEAVKGAVKLPVGAALSEARGVDEGVGESVPMAVCERAGEADSMGVLEPDKRAVGDAAKEGTAARVPAVEKVPPREPVGTDLVVGEDKRETLDITEGVAPLESTADVEGDEEMLAPLDSPEEVELEGVTVLLGNMVLEEEGEKVGTGLLVDIGEKLGGREAPALGESWEAVGAKELSGDCVPSAEAVKPRVPWLLCVDAPLAVGTSVPCALTVGMPDSVGNWVPFALPEACAVGVEAPTPLLDEEVGAGVRVGRAPDGDTCEDTVSVARAEAEGAPEACPDRLAEAVG